MTRKIVRRRSLARVFSDSTLVNRATNAAIAKAIDMHRRAGNRIAVFRNRKIVRIVPRKVPA
jgi:hypothetical protein